MSKLSPFDAHDFASQAAAHVTLNIGDALNGLPVQVENEIEELLGNEFEQLLNRLEITRDGDVQLLTEDGLVVREHPEPVTH